MALMAKGRLSVIIMSIDRAIFGGFRIQRLSLPYFSLFLKSPTKSGSYVSKS